MAPTSTFWLLSIIKTKEREKERKKKSSLSVLVTTIWRAPNQRLGTQSSANTTTTTKFHYAPNACDRVGTRATKANVARSSSSPALDLMARSCRERRGPHLSGTRFRRPHARTHARRRHRVGSDRSGEKNREGGGGSQLIRVAFSHHISLFLFFFCFFFYFSWHKLIWLIVSCNKFFSSYILTCNFCMFMKKNEEGTSSELGDAPLAAPPDVARGSTRTLISDV